MKLTFIQILRNCFWLKFQTVFLIFLTEHNIQSVSISIQHCC